MLSDLSLRVAPLALLGSFALTSPGCASAPTVPASAPDTKAPPSGNPFAGCRGEREFGLLSLDCADRFYNLSEAVTDNARLPALREATLSRTLEQVAAYGALQGKPTPFALALPDSSAASFELTLEDEKGPRKSRGLVAVVAVAEDRLRIILCLDGTPAEQPTVCPEVALALARDELPDSLPITITGIDLHFVGRPLQIPEGCHSNTGEDITCKGHGLTWTPIAPGADEAARDELRQDILDTIEKISGHPAPAPSTQACAFEGNPASCAHYAMGAAGGPAAHFVVGTTRLREQEVQVVCYWLEGAVEADPLPELCTQVMFLDPSGDRPG